jgi:C1A family cysteine protease
MKHAYGYRPDQRDFRDYTFSPTVAKLPAAVDLRTTKHLPPVYDQGQLGSCTANALAAAYDYDRKKQGKACLTPSRLFIYWNERNLEGTVSSDAGAAIRDGVKVLKSVGVCPEPVWPYVIGRFATTPSATAIADAKTNLALTYRRINRSLTDMKSALAGELPFVAGISVYESFESDQAARTGVIPMPQSSEQLLGGHAILVVGYDDKASHFVCRNSWGKGWGIAGYFHLPYSYLTNTGLSSDMWVIETVEAANAAA